MAGKEYQKRMADATRVAEIMTNMSPAKRSIVAMMTNAFISGMEAQERLAAEKAS